jgi:aspartyl-tRNA(Asn)/glutamyl-tRNA(Gln) amidotransferase subunit A
VHKTPEIALEQAVPPMRACKGGDAPAMCGIPLGIKDLFCTEGVREPGRLGSSEGFRPEYESTVTAQLLGCGRGDAGQAQHGRVRHGLVERDLVYGNAVEPLAPRGRRDAADPRRLLGRLGRAVAADLCLAATGTDTGGSIRQPAAFTGIVGLKPTYGRCSRWGIVAFASSLDQAGPMTKTVRDAAIMLQAMAGHDPKDSTSADLPSRISRPR